MREVFKNLEQSIQQILTEYGTLVNGLKSEQRTKFRRQLEKSSKKVIECMEKVDTLIPDNENTEIELPFSSDKFAEAWSEYKEYLLETHHIVLPPIAENKRVTKLFRISSKNEERAIQILDHLICTLQKNIYPPTKFQLQEAESTGEISATPEEEAQSFTLQRQL